MSPSIFNDVIGPVMRGPSSSHTAAAHRIGAIIRQVCLPDIGKVLVEFDRKGSLATTYEGQGSAMGLISGLLGLSILDPSIVRFMELAKECGLDIRFLVTDFKASHPNTYKIQVENENQEFRFVAVSTGGGMIRINLLNDFEVSIRGDFYETLVYCESQSDSNIQNLFQLLKNQTMLSEIDLYKQGGNKYLVNIKSRESLSGKVKELLSGFNEVKWIRHIDPVMPILSGVSKPLPFTSVNEMMDLAEQKDMDLADLAILYESERAGIDSQKVISLMRDIVLTIKNSINEGLNGTFYDDRILGQQSHLIREAEKANRIFQTPMNTVIAYVTALMEVKSSMGIIVAAPTAGSSGLLGGAIFGAAEGFTDDIDRITKAFLAAGLIGVFIAGKYTFAAEEGGCQVECGAASGMAAA